MSSQLPPASFGEWLKHQRKLRDLTQAELAQRTGCARVTIRKFEAGELRPSKQMAERLAQALDLPAGERAAFVQFARGQALPAGSPATRAADAAPANNLPLKLTRFIGREHEVADVKRLLGAMELPGVSPGFPAGSDGAAVRLLTLTGTGGTGKTRLALQVAAEFLGDPLASSSAPRRSAYPAQGGAAYSESGPSFKDGVWLIELASITDPALVPVTAATALGVREEPGRPILASLLESLRHKALLIVLDNCEHLLAACAAFADAVLRTCAEVRILTTSREALGIAGETAWPVPTLPTLDPAEPQTLKRLAQYTVVQLFVERARQSRATYRATASNAAAIAQICYRLDGIPLAIELAAARVKTMRVEQIAERLDDRFRLLTGGSRTALPRQQTLRALVDWSYNLLSEPERILLRRLSVFSGGWTLEAAEAVCAGGGIASADVLDLLAYLVQKSLVMLDEQAAAPRYRMLETIRQYADLKTSFPH